MQIPRSPIRIADDRTSVSAEALKRSLLNHLFYLRGKVPETATPHDYYVALVQTIRDRLLSPWLATHQVHTQQRVKRVGYFSSALFTSTPLGVYLTNLGITEPVRQVIEEFGLSLESLLQQESARTGLGASGQLVTYSLDSLTTLEIPAIGYGIRYEQDSAESCLWGGELPFSLTRYYTANACPNAWEISRPEQAVTVQFGGTTESYLDDQGQFCVRWHPSQVIWSVPYDTPVSGYQTSAVNTLRLWSAAGVESFHTDLSPFRSNDDTAHLSLENLAKLPFLNLDAALTQQTQLQRQFFLISCSLQDILRIHCVEAGQPIETLSNAFTLQLQELNQTIAIVELMRLLLDNHYLGWEQAWQITQDIFIYTHCASYLNVSTHWSTTYWTTKLLSQLLPRHLEIIYEINRRFVADIQRQYPDQPNRVERMSLIEEGEEQQVRIAHLAWVGSHRVNGLPSFQPKRLQQEYLQDFYSMFPERFQHQMNQGISHRSIASSNPQLSNLISGKIGQHWTQSFREMSRLESLLEDPMFRESWRSIKQCNKQAFADWLFQKQQISIDIHSLFNVHCRPISQQRRQLLSIFYIITLYNRIKNDPAIEITPRTFLFSEKTELSCEHTTTILHLIHAVAAIVNPDPDVDGRLKVVSFNPTALPAATLASATVPTIYAVADLAEQLEVADTDGADLNGFTFALNGALTIGTLTGTTVQFCNQVGKENCFWFGLTTEEVIALRNSGYEPLHFYRNHRELQGVIDRIAKGYFSTTELNPFKKLIDTILDQDEHLLLADYPFYVHCQDRLGEIYSDPERWTRLSILNTARMAEFSSDRVIHDYCQDIWHVRSVPISL